MFSKLSLVLVAEASASAVTSMSTAYAYTLDCQECIRSGFIYNVPTNQDTTSGSVTYSQNLKGLLATGASYAGECCNGMTDTTNCATSIASANTLATNWATVNPASVDTDLAVARCPTKFDLCGATKEITIADTSAATQTVTMSGAWTAGDSCTWLVKTECGAPAFTIGGDVTDSDVEVYYMEYTASEVNLDGNWPAEKLVDATTYQTAGVPNYSNANTINRAGELPYFKLIT